MRLPFIQVDAFASRPFTGNQAAVLKLDTWLDDDVLQAIAAENNLADTAFLIPDTSDAADYELRWFTPTIEVALCGHATLASGHVILAEQASMNDVRFRTRQSGVLTVARDGDGYAMTLPSYCADPKPQPDTVAALGEGAVETLWHERRYALIIYPNAAAVRALSPDLPALRAQGDVLYIATAPGDGDESGAEVVSRVFAPGAGIDEDPVTGSAHSVLTPYWTDRLGRDSFTAYQASMRGGHIGCQMKGDDVVLNGQCVTVLTGEFLL